MGGRIAQALAEPRRVRALVCAFYPEGVQRQMAAALLIDGLGHSLPRGVWPTIWDAIQKHVAQAIW